MAPGLPSIDLFADAPVGDPKPPPAPPFSRVSRGCVDALVNKEHRTRIAQGRHATLAKGSRPPAQRGAMRAAWAMSVVAHAVPLQSALARLSCLTGFVSD
jgi:hypothetical protein